MPWLFKFTNVGFRFSLCNGSKEQHFQRYAQNLFHYFTRSQLAFIKEGTLLSMLVCVFELTAAGLMVFRTLTSFKAEAFQAHSFTAFIFRQGLSLI